MIGPSPNVRNSLLRLATGDDAAAIAAIYAPFVATTHVSLEETPPTACSRGSSANADRARRDTVLGGCQHVHERHQRTGVARAAYGALLRLLARQRYYNAFAGVKLPNDATGRT